jgi:methylmalonyl-CoA/ethylmalonyl-CoA epimerase
MVANYLICNILLSMGLAIFGAGSRFLPALREHLPREQTLDYAGAMIGRLNHVAIVVPDLAAASELYERALGARVSEPLALPAHGVTVVFVELPNTRIELLEPLGVNSPVRGFLERHPEGGMHHLCYEVDDIIAARDRLRSEGARVLGDGEPRLGAHDKPVLFLHPKDLCGTLIELEEA